MLLEISFACLNGSRCCRLSGCEKKARSANCILRGWCQRINYIRVKVFNLELLIGTRTRTCCFFVTDNFPILATNSIVADLADATLSTRVSKNLDQTTNIVEYCTHHDENSSLARGGGSSVPRIHGQHSFHQIWCPTSNGWIRCSLPRCNPGKCTILELEVALVNLDRNPICHWQHITIQFLTLFPSHNSSLSTLY